MGQSRLRWMVGIGSAIIVALVVLAAFLQPAVTARLPRICIPQYSADSVCYAKAEILTSHKATAIAISASGNILAMGDDATIELWDLQTRKILQRLVGHNDLITALAISPNEQLLSSSSLDGTIRLWSLKTGEFVGKLDSGRASTLVFSPDGRILASGSRVHRWADGPESPLGVQFWDTVTRQRVYSLGDQPMRAIAFSPDGQLLAAGSDRTQVWKLQDGDLLYTLNSGELTGLVFCQEGQTLISSSSKVKIWDLRNGALLRNFDSGASDLMLSPDGQVLATSAGGFVYLWHLPTEQLLGSLRGSWYSGLSVKFALQGEAILSAGTDGVRIWRNVPPPHASL